MDWFHDVFRDQVDLNMFDEKYFGSRESCLIDRPEITMRHGLIDFDAKSAADMVLQTTKIPPGARTKPVLAVVRGMGSGKIRCLEEIRRELLKRPGVLTIGITYGNNRKVKSLEERLGKTPNAIFCFSVIARCASVFYGKEFGRMITLILDNLPRLDVPGNSDFIPILRDFFKFVVTKTRSQGRVVNELVLIVDEVVKIEDKLKELFPERADAKSNFWSALIEQLLKWFLNINRKGDYCSDLRAALLDTYSTPFDFNTTLCISS